MAAIDEKEYTQSFDWKIWKRLGPFLRPYRGAFVSMLVFNGICALVDVVLPLFQKYAIQNFIEKNTLTGLVPYALAYLAVILVQALSVVIFARNSMHIEMNLGKDMRGSLFHHLQTLSFSFYNVTPVGYLLTRVMSDTNRISSMLAWNFTDILWAVFYVLGTFAAMLALNWRLALAVIAIVPVMAILTGYFQNRILHWNRKVRKLNSRITGAFNEGITGARTTKTLVTEEQTADAFRSLTRQMHDSGIRAARLNAVFIPLVLFFGTMAVSIVLLRGGYMVLDQALELATLSAFTAYAVSIFDPIQMTAANLAEFISLQASIERVTDLMDEQPQIQDTPEVIEKYGDAFHPKRENWEPLRGEIEFRDVTFRYPDGGENVLEHFSLHIPQGTTVAIVGETGAGKTTLIRLILALLRPQEGEINLYHADGDGQQLSPRMRCNFVYVPQGNTLMSGTIRDNLLMGSPTATDDEMFDALHQACADFVSQLPDGLDTRCSESGAGLSEGQAQRIAIARALLRNRPVMLFDEATSALDIETERRLLANVLGSRQHTIIFITHRPAVVEYCDEVLRL